MDPLNGNFTYCLTTLLIYLLVMIINIIITYNSGDKISNALSNVELTRI